MNYIKQILAFQDLVEIEGLTTGQIALWHALINVNNKCGWREWFSVASAKLEIGSGLSSAGVRKVRKSLKDLGIIDYQTQGAQATKYHLTDLTELGTTEPSSGYSSGIGSGEGAPIVAGNVAWSVAPESEEKAQLLPNGEDSSGGSSGNSSGTSSGVGTQIVAGKSEDDTHPLLNGPVGSGYSSGTGSGSSSTLYKLNKTKRNSNINIITPPTENDEPVALENLSQFYQENIGPINPVMYENLQDSLQDFTEQGTKSAEAEEIIKLAISKSVENNKRSWGYIHAILKDWLDHRIYTLASVKTYQRDWRHKKDRPKGQTGYDFNENDPDYDPKRLEGLF